MPYDWGISCAIPLIWRSLGFTDDKWTLVQVMAWCRQAGSHYLSQCLLWSMLPCGIAKPRWVKLTLIMNYYKILATLRRREDCEVSCVVNTIGTREKYNHWVSSGWNSIWLRSNIYLVGLAILAISLFCVNILAVLLLICTLLKLLFLLADMLLQHTDLFQC